MSSKSSLSIAPDLHAWSSGFLSTSSLASNILSLAFNALFLDLSLLTVRSLTLQFEHSIGSDLQDRTTTLAAAGSHHHRRGSSNHRRQQQVATTTAAAVATTTDSSSSDNFGYPKTLEVYTCLDTGVLTTLYDLGNVKVYDSSLPQTVPHSPETLDMDAFFEDISANNVPTPQLKTTGLKLALQTRMACVTPRSHGGDAGGSPPRRPTRPSAKVRNCSMLRIETENRSLRKAFRENNEQPLKIGFDYEDLVGYEGHCKINGMARKLQGGLPKLLAGAQIMHGDVLCNSGQIHADVQATRARERVAEEASLGGAGTGLFGCVKG
ncbi:hypothetical protein Tco_0005265 [Tanacetum coccineum]